MDAAAREDGIPTTFRIGGKILRRLRYGEEEEDWGAGRGEPCHGLRRDERRIAHFRLRC